MPEVLCGQRWGNIVLPMWRLCAPGRRTYVSGLRRRRSSSGKVLFQVWCAAEHICTYAERYEFTM